MIGVVDPILQSVSGAASPYLSCETYMYIFNWLKVVFQCRACHPSNWTGCRDDRRCWSDLTVGCRP